MFPLRLTPFSWAPMFSTWICLAEAGRCWQMSAEVGSGWQKPAEEGREQAVDWPKLAESGSGEYGEGQQRQAEAGKDKQRLVRAARGLAEADRGNRIAPLLDFSI